MKVLIIMGSETDESVMEVCKDWLLWFGIDSDMVVASAHRNPDMVREIVTQANMKGYSAIVVAAGMAAALPAVCAAYTTLPVFAVPLEGGLTGGTDPLNSVVQTQIGQPVGTLAAGKHGAKNAAILCARVFALKDAKIAQKLTSFETPNHRI
ncbi:MAG: AIR carboxylase family protein [Chitinophagia bacterium]|nr:AIR carboxylase family protein [Chitinophagia bacterium]